ncbi:PAS domain-containing sensor histidine kinase [Aegicerativicinus sediminis]|uniref:PAS domain-containing sensor histidine kinase n=1 Tax=Aegicerativicinus sediminis TaxID=2893202 RepID=UPI001E46731F|nr:PAS domain-containing sensor histidine kinase [Aegicerativicinus sediminis]
MLFRNQYFFKSIFNKISEGIIIVDEKQQIIDTNLATDTMFGYQKNYLKKKSINILIPEEYHSKHKIYFKDFLDEGQNKTMGYEQNIHGVKSDGQFFPIEVSLTPFKIFEKKYVLVLVFDISFRVNHERSIRELNSALENKVKKRTAELKATIVKLEKENKKRIKAENETKNALIKEKELNDLKSKFLSMVSHEFKTPLSGILTSAMLISKYKNPEQQDKREAHLKIISEKVHFLNGILDDFLSVEKLEKGKINYMPTKFMVSKIVEEVIYNANTQLKEGQNLIYSEKIDGFELYQDEKVVELILANLVNNAIKYSPEESTIAIKITQDDLNTVFSVKDNGIGIPEKDQKNIFKRYFRADNVLLTQGTGIGLNIVKHHVENLGGSISFASVENKGSEFTFSIPNIAVYEKSFTY